MHCIYCGSQISEGAAFCAYCGRRQPDEQVTDGTSNGAALTDSGIHQDSGDVTQVGAYAHQFGGEAEDCRGEVDHAMANEAAEPEVEKSSRNNKTHVGVGLAVTLALVVLGGTVAYSMTTGHFPFLSTATGGDTTSEPTPESTPDPAPEPIPDPTPDPTPVDNSTYVDLGDASVGDEVRMGNYPPDDSYAEPVSWIVLDEQGDHLLLLSKKAIDCRPMSKELSYNYDITWEKSDVRAWLNGSFLKSFSDEDLARIDTTLVETSHDGNVKDKVFLLSMAECNVYVDGNDMRAELTPYAIERGAVDVDNEYAYWWLRDYNASHAGVGDDNHFAVVFSNGEMNDLGYLATSDDIAIRPAMWVNRAGAGMDVDFSTGAFSMEEQKPQPEPGNEPASDDADGSGTSIDTIDSDSTSTEDYYFVEPAPDGRGDNTVYVEVEAKDGTQLSGLVRRDANDYVIADSSDREYTMAELEALDLSDAELCIAWNEPFARLGYHFSNSGLNEYFGGCSWYVDGGQTFSISGVGAHNNALLREIAERNASSRQWESLAVH